MKKKSYLEDIYHAEPDKKKGFIINKEGIMSKFIYGAIGRVLVYSIILGSLLLNYAFISFFSSALCVSNI